MATRAYVLVKTESGQIVAARDALRAVPGVTAVDITIGPYDLILQAEAADLDEIGTLVLFSIQAVKGVESTLTCPVLD